MTQTFFLNTDIIPKVLHFLFLCISESSPWWSAHPVSTTLPALAWTYDCRSWVKAWQHIWNLFSLSVGNLLKETTLVRESVHYPIFNITKLWTSGTRGAFEWQIWVKSLGQWDEITCESGITWCIQRRYRSLILTTKVCRFVTQTKQIS